VYLRNSCGTSKTGNAKEEGRLGGRNVGLRSILKWALNRQDGTLWTGFEWFRAYPVRTVLTWWTPWNRKCNSASATQKIRIIFWNLECSSPRSKQPASPYLEPHQVQALPSCLLESILILSCSYAWVFKVVFPSGFPIKALCSPFLSPYVLHASPTVLCLISEHSNEYWVSKNK